MITPRKINLWQDLIEVGAFPSHVKTDSDLLEMLGRKEGEKVWVAVWNGLEFKAVYLDLARSDIYENYAHIYLGHYDTIPSQFGGQVFYPIDPRMKREWVQGATQAYANATNDGWLFAPCDADYMHDREKEIRSGIVSTFQPFIDKLTVELDTKEYVFAAARDDNGRSSARSQMLAVRLKKGALIEFRDKVVANALTTARSRYIGWYHHNPLESHIHNLVHDSITTTMVKEKDDTEFGRIRAEAQAAAVSLALHAYETPWDQEARIAAEAKAAAAKAAAEAVSEGDGNGND